MGTSVGNTATAGQTVVALGGIVLALLAWRSEATRRLAEPREGEPVSARLQVDLNHASVEELMLLPGLGPTLAGRIVEHRQTVGSFASLDALSEVQGVGVAKIRGVAPYLTVSPELAALPDQVALPDFTAPDLTAPDLTMAEGG